MDPTNPLLFFALAVFYPLLYPAAHFERLTWAISLQPRFPRLSAATYLRASSTELKLCRPARLQNFNPSANENPLS